MSKIAMHAGRGVAVALGGPVVAGAILGLRAGPRPTLAMAAGLPAIVAAVTLLTTPTLYVGGALLGRRLSLAEVARATGEALHALGLALLGLAPLSLLLATTSVLPGKFPFSVQVALLVVVALAITLRRLAMELEAARADGSWQSSLLFPLLLAAHAAIAFVIGARLFIDLVSFSERIAS
jgi:hypothetical protein